MFTFASDICLNFELGSIFKWSSCMSLQSEKRSSNFMYLMVEFPRVKANDKEYSIVYYEKVSAVLRYCMRSEGHFSTERCNLFCFGTGWR